MKVLFLCCHSGFYFNLNRKVVSNFSTRNLDVYKALRKRCGPSLLISEARWPTVTPGSRHGRFPVERGRRALSPETQWVKTGSTPPITWPKKGSNCVG